jgi:hypothetical protein
MNHVSPGEEILEVVEIEIFAIEEKPLPHARHYVIRVDKEKVTVDRPEITGAEILEKVNKTPAQYKLYEHRRHHQPKLIRPEEVVHLHAHHIERFTTMPKGTTEGLEAPCRRQDFRLPESDEAYLDRLGLSWEALRDGPTRWLIIHDWKIPPGYNHPQTSLALLIPDNYSDSQIDMVYFNPHLARRDGRAIGALSTQNIAGAAWQRWSRHRTSASPWRPGVDDVASHLALVDDWLQREFSKAL